MFEQELERASALYGLPLDAKQIEKFGIYYRLLIEWNAKMNLTAITEPREVAVKHIVDSLTALRGIEERDSLRRMLTLYEAALSSYEEEQRLANAGAVGIGMAH